MSNPTIHWRPWIASCSVLEEVEAPSSSVRSGGDAEPPLCMGTVNSDWFSGMASVGEARDLVQDHPSDIQKEVVCDGREFQRPGAAPSHFVVSLSVEERHGMGVRVAESWVAGHVCHSQAQLPHQFWRLLVLDAHQEPFRTGELEERLEHGTLIFSESFISDSFLNSGECDATKVSNRHQTVPSEELELFVVHDP